MSLAIRYQKIVPEKTTEKYVQIKYNALIPDQMKKLALL